MKRIILAIDGMTCSACSSGLEKYLNKQNGIYNSSVNLVMANATIEYDEQILSIEKLEEYVKKAGFKSLGEFKNIDFLKEKKNNKAKFIIFTILALLLMYISMGHMLNLPTISFLSMHTHPNYYCLILLILTIPFLFYGYDIIKNGIINLIHLIPNMDTLVSIGVLTSFLYSLYNMSLVFIGNESAIMNLYFESSAIIIYFIKLGRFIDGVSKDKTKEAIGALVSITPKVAYKKVGKKIIEVSLDEIKKGDILVCKAGDKIAVDGLIKNGSSHFDESFITGESKPVNKTINDKVLAGSMNYDGYIEYEADKIGKDSTISEIVRLVIEASNTKAPISKLADKVSSIFVPIVILIAFLTLFISLILTKNISSSLITFVTILVVACPCSLGLATPLAIVVSEGLCASNGILIKKSEILERVGKINTIVFDKTGTLTYGKLKVSHIYNYSNYKDEELMQIVGSIENLSNHPIATSITNYLEDNKISLLDVKDFKNIRGYGIKAKIDKKEYFLGNSKLLSKYKIKNNYAKDEATLTNEGNSLIYVIENKKVIALIGVNDIIRPNISRVISYLKAYNINPIMLTGDNKTTAHIIASSIGIDNYISDVIPKEKSDEIKKLQNDNKCVMMVGDGINDSPALTTSDIGVSIESGTDIATDSADVILINNDLNSIIKLIKISNKTIKIIKENLFWAFFYNTLMIPIACGLLKPWGLSINPMIASLAMVLSSLTVILNTLRLKRVKY